MNTFRTAAASTAAAALLASGAAVTGAAPASAADVTVSIHKDDGANGVVVANAIQGLQSRDRGAFVSEAVTAAFDNDGGDHSVVMMNLSQGYSANFSPEDTRLYANVEYEGIYYGLWIVDGGSFTNSGDGGYINWAFQGWYERVDQTVNFYRP